MEIAGDSMKRVTIQDVARELNLSRNTVSKALSNSSTVAYETRYLVIEKAYEMGYSKLSPAVLNQFKIRDKLDNTKAIVVLARREISVFWNSIIMGISDELKKYGCKLQINFISEQDEKNLNISFEQQRDIGGIIVLSVFSNEFISQIIKQNLAVVFLDCPKNPEKVKYMITALDRLHNESKGRIISTGQSAYFLDVGLDFSWAVNAIDELFERKIILGNGNGMFFPSENTKRKDFIIMVVRAFGLDAESETNFIDVPENAYYHNEAGIAKKLGLMPGNDENFYPEENIVREEMIVILLRAIAESGQHYILTGLKTPLERYFL
jgi:transcriptional regulator with XRE-family HTH domain